MRSTEESGIEEVRRQFEAWRAAPRARRIPDSLWTAASSLVGRYSSSRICRELRLNPSRFKLACESGRAKRHVRSKAVARAEGGMFLEMPAGVGQPRWIRTDAEPGQWRLTLESGRGVLTVVALGDDAAAEEIFRALVGMMTNRVSR